MHITLATGLFALFALTIGMGLGRAAEAARWKRAARSGEQVRYAGRAYRVEEEVDELVAPPGTG